jgi:hypothetical protein
MGGSNFAQGKRHVILPGMESSASLSNILKEVLSSVSSATKAPVCQSTVTLDLRSSQIRVSEVGGLVLSLQTDILTTL